MDRLEGRAQCYRCHRPTALCLCPHVPRVGCRTSVQVLQHPRERFHPLGTARFLELGLARARVTVAYGSKRRSVDHAMVLPPGTALLYPAQGAPFLEDLPACQWPQQLLLLDGTWAQSRALYRQNPWLHDLPHVQIRPTEPSRYRVRKEPKAHCVSTLEAVAYALSILEPEVDLAPLIDAFERLMDDHLAQRGSARQARQRRPRQKPSRAVPPVMLAPGAPLSVLYVEPSLPDGAPGPRQPVQLCALRLRDGARFEVFARAYERVPEVRHLRHMHLSPEHYIDAVHVEDAVRAMDAFLQGSVTASWNGTSPQLLRAAGGAEREHVVLKAAYCNLRKRHAGALEDLLLAEGASPAPLAFAGRAGQRMGNALALLELLQREAAPARIASTCGA